ncbi:signal peptidase I [Pseudoroseomonas wenyumeiae]|uniref:Signal peptidase I n=1 Tax=Teichococcus wenyumeiae TaxID=2478470 RepID=A0A3A9JNK3_9PROT|nr:signal peptidase I [Pseudoroseomonas wenyumeiae]RKK06095.1 signal peptidase I [Pseudoroseomonas wenyumeiae]RMI25584.1 signal peptidase I [Pseudoroseomonas wenyumeiae]
MTNKKKPGGWLESLKTVVYAGLIAIGIRTVAFEPFNIPSGSMIPTLLVGDYLFVSKYAYGYSKHSLPFSPDLFEGRIFGSLPARGDVAVFKFPRDNSTDYIKRIIGLPGDRVQVRQGRLYLNGQEVPRESLGLYTVEGDGPRITVRQYRESLPASPGSPARQHQILEASDDQRYDNTPEFLVPPGHVFAMGDNRDNSLDSRDMSIGVGFVPLENLVGRAEMIFFSVDGSAAWWEVWAWPFAVRWDRLLTAVR